MTTTHPESDLPRVGAQSAEAGAFDAMGDDGEWPQMLFLKGDEPYFGEFTLEADEVMRLLGIRRSRLTQISGRELRVARVRAGRYIKPLYRLADVEDYLQISKAPTTHVKAAKALEESGAHVARQIDEMYQSLRVLLTDELREEQTARAALQASVQATQTKIDALTAAWERSAAAQAESLSALSKLVQDAQSHAEVLYSTACTRASAQMADTLKMIGETQQHMTTQVDQVKAELTHSISSTHTLLTRELHAVGARILDEATALIRRVKRSPRRAPRRLNAARVVMPPKRPARPTRVSRVRSSSR